MRLTPAQAALAGAHVATAKRAVVRARSHNMGAYMDWDTMLSAAMFGLCKAARTYDPARGRFENYAYRRCMGQIVDDARTLDGQASLRSRSERNAGVPSRVAMSLDSEIEALALRGEVDMTYHEVIPDPAPQIFEQYATAERREQIERVIDTTLRPREAAVVRLHVFHGWTLREVGEFFGVTESRISQLKIKALAKLEADLKPLLEA